MGQEHAQPPELESDVQAPADQSAGKGSLGEQAAAAPAMARLRAVAAQVGPGRPTTETGNLKLADARALAIALGAPEPALRGVRSVDDLPEVARLVQWAAASGVVTARRSTIIPGPLAPALEHDPLAVWTAAATTLVERGVLAGFRKGWRKIYVPLLDESVAGLLKHAAESDAVPQAALEEERWQLVAKTYDYAPDDVSERQQVTKQVRAILSELADLGAVRVGGGNFREGDVAITPLGTRLAGLV